MARDEIPGYCASCAVVLSSAIALSCEVCGSSSTNVTGTGDPCLLLQPVFASPSISWSALQLVLYSALNESTSVPEANVSRSTRCGGCDGVCATDPVAQHARISSATRA